MKTVTDSNTVVLFQTILAKAKTANFIIDQYDDEFKGLTLDGVNYYFPKEGRVHSPKDVKSMNYGAMQVQSMGKNYILKPIKTYAKKDIMSMI